MKDFLRCVQEKVLLYDGSKGVMLQMRGLKGEEAAESWNLIKPEEVKNIYRLYKQAGVDVLQTNTFPGNSITLGAHGLKEKVYEINYAGVKLAKEIAGEDIYVAASVGPTGLFFEPAGSLTFDHAYNIFKEQLQAVEDAGADLVNFETFTDLNELRAAILAAKENTKLTVIASATFHRGSKTLAGNPAEVCAIVCQALGADLVGANCSGGPDSLLEPIKKMHTVASVPLSVKANAGLPVLVDGKTIFKQTPEEFSSYTKEFVESGVRLIGGCCGTTPEHITAIAKKLDQLKTPALDLKSGQTMASPYKYIELNHNSMIRQVSFKEPNLTEALSDGSFMEIIEVVKDYESEGAECLLLAFDDIGETNMWEFMSILNISLKVPIIIKANSIRFVSRFLRYYPGIAGVVVTQKLKKHVTQIKEYGALLLTDDLKAFDQGCR